MTPDRLLEAAGDLRREYEDVDWAGTALGPVESWTPALRNAVDLALHTQFPVTLLWGPEFVMLYNAAYVELIADKHPAALGSPAREVFPEAWDAIGPMMESVLAGHGATWVEDELVPLVRRGAGCARSGSCASASPGSTPRRACSRARWRRCARTRPTSRRPACARRGRGRGRWSSTARSRGSHSARRTAAGSRWRCA